MTNEDIIEAITTVAKYNIQIKWGDSYTHEIALYSYIDGYSCKHQECYDEWNPDIGNTQSKLGALIKTANYWKSIKEGDKV